MISARQQRSLSVDSVIDCCKALRVRCFPQGRGFGRQGNQCCVRWQQKRRFSIRNLRRFCAALFLLLDVFFITTKEQGQSALLQTSKIVFILVHFQFFYRLFFT